jgi:phthiodiolone/phenolphthiodiolone dimycocerosates ketoreductase
MFEASGVVDWFQTWDQLVSFMPQALWRPDATPMAQYSSDCDSYYDAAMVAMLAANATTSLNITTTLDAVRNGPAEILQKMVTLAATTEARVALQLGAGEIKQCKPFGYKRSQGLARMEDIYAIIAKLLDTDGLVSHEGKHWNYDGAWIGAHWPKKPQFWALGGGPKLLELATTYADGFISMVPSAVSRPDAWAELVAGLRTDLERKDRDPDDFTFGFWPFVLAYETESQRDRLMGSPIVKWMTAVFGRLHHGDWLDEGEKLIFGADWMYALKLLPHQMSQAEVDEVVAGVTESMIEKSWLIGTPEEIARQLDPWIDGGANYIAPSDLAPAALELHEQAGAMERMIELAAHMKGVHATAH